MDYSAGNHILREDFGNSNIFNTRYLWKRKGFEAEIPRKFEERQNLSVGKPSDQNTIIPLFHEYFTRGRKFSKHDHNLRIAADEHELFQFRSSINWYAAHSKSRLTPGAFSH